MSIPKVLHFIRSVDPSLGGPIQAIKSLHTGTKGRLDVAVVSLDSPHDPWVREFPLPILPIGPGSGVYGFSWSALARLEATSRKADVVVVDGLWQYSSVLARRFARRRQVPLFTFPHGMMDPWFKKRYPLKHLKKCLYWPLGDYKVMRDSTKVLFTSQLECETARESFPWLYRVNEHVLGLGCPPPPDESPSCSEAFYSACPGAKGRQVVLFLSRIHEKKGCDICLRAFRETFAKDDSAVLVMAGPCHDDYVDRMKELADELGIGEKVLWPGMLSGDAKWGAFYRSQAFVLPSHQENFGIALAEALACGLPTLTTSAVNIHKEIQSYEAGFVSLDDVPGTVAIYERFMRLSHEERVRLRENARRCYGDCFDARNAGGRLADLIQEELARPTLS